MSANISIDREEVAEFCQRHQVEMPITHEVYRVLYEHKTPIEAVTALMSRKGKSEEA